MASLVIITILLALLATVLCAIKAGYWLIRGIQSTTPEERTLSLALAGSDAFTTLILLTASTALVWIYLKP